MITISINRENNLVKNIKISGHADYDNVGKDIVCASVSSILITTVNACLKLNDKSLKYINNDIFSIDIINHDIVTDTLIDNMLDLLKELEKQYKKNIEIK